MKNKSIGLLIKRYADLLEAEVMEIEDNLPDHLMTTSKALGFTYSHYETTAKLTTLINSIKEDAEVFLEKKL